MLMKQQAQVLDLSNVFYSMATCNETWAVAGPSKESKH